MKNIKVRTKLTIILALVIVLVTSESFISIKNMNQLKNKALETMDTSSRQNYSKLCSNLNIFHWNHAP
jgi:methyl-accepting chemotaxis protein